ncbi:MAG: extracellular solute-binding protein [bacterium]|nr:extracellular solute-binding protein [bacterium]
MKQNSILCALMILSMTVMLSGCKGTPDSIYTAKNNIFTYEKIDPDKTQIIVSKTGNIGVDQFSDEFEKRNPDIQIINIDLTGGNIETQPVADWVVNGHVPDIMIAASRFMDDQYADQYFENLSANPVIQNFETAALNRVAVNSNVYWLPGPSEVSCMIYNKTMFDEHGWTPPTTFDEFVNLCIQIREETDGAVEPWNPNAKYSNEFLTAMEAMYYEELFGGVEHYSWYEDFISDKATFQGHMEPFYEGIQTLIDNEILREEHFSYSATTRGEEFRNGKIAMINMLATDYDNDEYDFGFIPFPTTKGKLGYVCDSFSSVIGVPKKEHTAKQQDAIDRFLAFFSSKEGQEIYIGDTLQVSNVKDTTTNQNEDLAALQPAIQEGHMFARIEFARTDGQDLKPNFSLYQDAYLMITEGKSVEECVAAVDQQAYIAEKEQETSEVIAEAAEDLSILETSFYIADMYREKTDADIALIADNVAFRGNLMRIFTGDITTSDVNTLKPRSFDNESALIKVKLTGQQLSDAMNNPPNYNEETADCIYAYSGLKCKVAPWNPLGEKYLSVQLEDGSAIDPAREYSVAIWNGTIAEKYMGEILETYEGTFEELLTEKLKKDGTIAPAKDNRIKLVWK